MIQRRILNRPEFGGMPAEREGQAPRVKKPFKYRALLEAVRAHPDTPAKVAEFPGPTIYATARLAQDDWNRIRKWLDLNFPEEYWEVKIRRTPGTWAQRDLWVIFHGHDPEAAARDKQRRRDKVRGWKEKAEINKARRAAEERRLAIRNNDENRRMNAGQR